MDRAISVLAILGDQELLVLVTDLSEERLATGVVARGQKVVLFLFGLAASLESGLGSLSLPDRALLLLFFLSQP